jgi:MerR family transcriptional regulator, light-induced transcriptional regulator
VAETSPGTAWTAGQVARNLGISESTLRTWHRRYGLSPPGAQPGRYRRYHPEDVARLRRMVELINLGMLASDAAQSVQGGAARAVPPARDVAELVTAAMALDTVRCDALLDSLFGRRGVVDAWELVCSPALRAVDAHLRDDPVLVAAEHALSWALLGALQRLPRPPTAPGAGLVLLACTESEQHTLPLAALSAALAGRRVPCRMLGAATPARSLERAVLVSRPEAVVLWAQRAETAAHDLLRALSRYPVHRIAAGPGWDTRRLAGARQITDLRGGVAALAVRAAGSPAAPDPARGARGA